MLALAHYIERQIDDGAIPDYAAAALALGVTRARLTQVMNLLLLPPEVQEHVLVGNVRGTMSQNFFVRRLSFPVATRRFPRSILAHRPTLKTS